MIKKKLVRETVNILRNLNKKYYDDDSKKKPLLEGEEQGVLFLQINLKKIPEKNKSVKMIKVLLPHSLMKDSDEVCLIMGDVDKKNHKAEIEPDILQYKQLLEEHGITCISEIVTLRQLRTDYKPFEAKQKLLAAYDMFLTDKKIAECLPRVLGKHFFKKRKFPIQINMKSSNVKQQIEKALSTKVFSVTGQGNTCCSEIGYMDMKDSEIFENIKAAMETLSSKLPGLWENVMGVYLKTSKSKAIPLYMSYDNANKIQLKGEAEDCPIIDDLSTLPNLKVKVHSDGSIKTFYFNEDDEKNEDLEVNALNPVNNSSSKTTEKELAVSENESEESETKQEIQNLEANAPMSVKNIKRSKKTKKGLAAAENEPLKVKIQDLEANVPVSAKNIKRPKTTKKGLAAAENESEQNQTKELQNLEANVPVSVKNIKRSKRTKKGLAAAENESEQNQTKEEFQNLEANVQVSEKIFKRSKRIKKDLTTAENESEQNQTKELQNLEANVPVSVKNIKRSKRTKKGLAAAEKESEQNQTKEEFQKKPIKVDLEKKKGLKRKMTESKPVANSNQTSMQDLKKRKVEGLNKKRDTSRKEPQKSNKKKENHSRKKLTL